MSQLPPNSAKEPSITRIVLHIAGDSGDGIQFAGKQLTIASAQRGYAVITMPNFPAEIRAPKGSLYGVSGFQMHVGSTDIYTPGDAIDVLVAFNAAALKKALPDIPEGKIILADEDGFNPSNLKKAGYSSNPLADGTLDNYQLITAPISKLTRQALLHAGVQSKLAQRSRNMFVLGMILWMFDLSLEETIAQLQQRFKDIPEIAQTNIAALKAGWNYAETVELLQPLQLPPENNENTNAGQYTIAHGYEACVWGLLAAHKEAKRPLFFSSYPITPSSDILQYIGNFLSDDVEVFQAEDEIAAISSAIGASFAGAIGVTSTSGPGFALKSEALGLAVMTELPLVVIDAQRAGPSTGMPTKTEQSDLLQALYGRNGEAPLIVLAASTPSNCLDYAYWAVKLALEHITPVVLLIDAYLIMGAQRLEASALKKLPPIIPHIASDDIENYAPYKRNPNTLARYWAYPPMKGKMHRIGGLEKEDVTGHVSYDPENHHKMVQLRRQKVERVRQVIPPLQTEFADTGELLVIGWGSTYGSIKAAVQYLYDKGHAIGHAHLHFIHPLPKNTEQILRKFDKIVVCELNDGQLHRVLQAEFPGMKLWKYNKIQGIPFKERELIEAFQKMLTPEHSPIQHNSSS